MTSARSGGLSSEDVDRSQEATVPRLRVHNFSISVDGYAAGPDQDLENPLGVGGERLHEWIFGTPTGGAMLGEPAVDAVPGVDDRFLARGEDGIGATIMGRNMFGPVRGPWPDEEWTGWWGEDPPFHHPVFVLTHHPRPPLTMAGGTTFTFVTDGIEAALAQARAAAGDADVRLGGGADVVRQYLRAGLVDELHVAVVPVLLGGGERLFEGPAPAGLECVEFAAAPTVAHVRIAREADRG
jgi:dihydrofolate reductase